MQNLKKRSHFVFSTLSSFFFFKKNVVFLLSLYEVYLLVLFLYYLQRAVISTAYHCRFYINTSILITSTCHNLLETDAGKVS